MNDTEPLPTQRQFPNRSKSCGCCGAHRVRDQVKIGTPTDPDYLIAVCPICDFTPAAEPTHD